MPDNSGVWKCSCVPGYVEKGDNCSKLPDGIFSDSEMATTIPATAPVGHTVLTTTFSQILDICTTNPEVTLVGDTSLFKAEVDSCQTLTISTLSTLPLESSVRKLMVKAKFENGVNVIMDAIFVTVTIQRTGGSVVVVLPDMTFSDHLVTAVAPGSTLSLSNSDYMTIGSNGAVYTTQQLSVDAISSESVEAAVPLTTNIQRRDGTSTSTTSLTAVILKTDIKTELSEDKANDYIVASFKRLHQSSLNVSVTSDLNNNIFAFDGTVLKVQNSVLLDYDNGERSFTFRMIVRITIDTDVIIIPVTVEIEVLPVNDNTPDFITELGQPTNQYTFVVFPTQLSSVVCGAVRARDADSGSQLTYTLDQQSGMTNYFSVGQNDGIVTTLVKTDSIPFINDTIISNAMYVTFPVQVQDENILHTDTATITVSLRQTPERNLGHSFNKSILEDASLQTSVISVYRNGYRNYEFASLTGSSLFFSLDTFSGQVSVSRSLDRETKDSYKFSVTAIEEQSQTCALVVLGDLTITILDANDNPPVFDRTSYYGKVDENMPSNTKVKIGFPITATDKDTGGFTFRITQESSFFSISQSGEISTRQTFDRETKSIYMVEVTADDGKNTNQAMVNVTIGDRNDNSPVFSSSSYSRTIQEGATNIILTIAATDADIGDNADLSYLLNGGGDAFVIGYESGVISAPTVLDREEQSSYSLVVTAIDGGDPPQSSTATVIVSVADVNDNSPEFLPSSLVITTDEEVSCVNPIGNVSASDKDDNDVLRYSSSDNQFNVDATSGEIRCKGRLDYEAKHQFNMIVIVGDTGTNPLQTTATVVIRLRDINDNTPSITHPGAASLQQNDFSTVKPVMVVDAEDKDSGNNGEVSFVLTGSNLVTIDDNGIISTVQMVPPPDAATYTAVVTVTDKGIPPLAFTSTVTLQVNADTTVDLKFLQQQHMFTVSEEQALNTVVGDVSQSLDNPKGLTAKYDIPNPTGKFAVNTDTGVISTKFVFDRESEAGHIVVVRVRADGATVGDLTLVNVSIADTNDHSPVFLRDKYRLIVEENVALSSVITTIIATDEDVGVNAETYFSLYNSAKSVCRQDFTIDEMNGELSVVKTLDYETYRACQFTVRAFDRSSSPRTSSIEVDVTITDVNDNSPTFSESTYRIEVAENIRSETSVFGTVSDADSNENGRIELSDSNTGGCPFRIKTDTTSLIMTLSGDIDYETQTSYTCFIVATDMAKSNRRTSSATVYVNITDVNDNAPVFDKQSYEVNISRDFSSGENVIVVMATDADSGLNKRIQYILTGDEGYLSINPNTGQVNIAKSLYDYRRDTMVTLVTAIDQLPGASDRLSSSVTLTINIDDANVRPNFPMLIVNNLELREETEITGVFYTVTANDWDGTTNRKCSCSYRLENPSSVFEIDSQTGEISMKAGSSLDRERDGSYYSIGIIARDQGSPPKDSETLILNMTVLDINDQAPQFRYSTIRTFKIYQTHPSGSSIGTVTAEDMDGSEFSKTLYNVTDLFYSASGTFSDRDTSVFGSKTIVVDSNNGTLRTTRSLELIGQTSTFYIMITVEAVDKGDPSMRDSTPVIIEVTYEDPNQHFPVFSQDLYQTEIPRSHSLNEVILRVTASDADAAPKNAISYSIIAGNYRDLMTVDPVTGDIKLAYLIDEKFNTSKLNLTVRASDSGDVPKYSSSIVKITLSGEYVSCFTAEMRTEIVAEKDLFFGVMIGLVGALCIAIGLCLVFIYKYRTAAKQLDVYNPSRNKKNEMTYQDLRPPSEQQEHEYTSNEGFVPTHPHTGDPGTKDLNHPYMSIKEAKGSSGDPPQTSPYASLNETPHTAIMNPAFAASADDVLVTVPHQQV
ncbi:protocadherin Fat 4-like [Pecten maximus]|uniref:protocadherin Fat 4-like n=1 Tax=Pecten maximus TaxID=6579 RepID=UPI0014590591|nr:protocadherin Fat 4-like [Pecten maximus]XP_033732974.1 protocadherin Fat 4-like [Pecten maximus]